MRFFKYFNTHFLFQPTSQLKWIGAILSAQILLFSCDTTSSVEPYQDQLFIKLYGGNGSEEGKDLILLPDGGFVLAGSSTSDSNGGKDVYVVRTDYLGDVIWENRFGEAGDDVGNSIILSNDNNSIYVCGEVTDSLSVLDLRDVYVLHISLDNGSLIGSARKYGENIRDEFGTDIIELDNGGFFITSTMLHPDTSKYYLIETNSNLDTIPSRSRFIGTQKVNNYSTRSFENMGDVNNPFICFGTSFRTENAVSSNWFHSFLYRSDGDATIEPEFYGSESENELCTDVYPTTDGGFVLAGLVMNQNLQSEMVVKIDPNRKIVWSRPPYQNEFSRNVQRCGVIQTRDGGFMISSTIELDDPLNDEISLLKLNSEGEEEWRKTYGSDENDAGAKVVQLEDGSYVVIGTIGFSINPDSQSKMCLMKVNPNGDLLPMK